MDTTGGRAKAELLSSIGWVTVSGGFLEAAMRYLFITLMRQPASLAPELVSAGQGFTWLHDNCVALVKQLPSYGEDPVPADLRDEFNECVADAQEAWSDRNHVVHGVWSGTSTTKHTYRRLDAATRDMSPSDVLAIADRLATASIRVTKLADLLNDRRL